MTPLVVDPCGYLKPHHSVGHCPFKRCGSAPRVSTRGCVRHVHDRSWDRANRCSDMNNGSDGDPEMLDLCADSCRPASFTQQQPEAVRAGPHRL